MVKSENQVEAETGAAVPVSTARRPWCAARILAARGQKGWHFNVVDAGGSHGKYFVRVLTPSNLCQF